METGEGGGEGQGTGEGWGERQKTVLEQQLKKKIKFKNNKLIKNKNENSGTKSHRVNRVRKVTSYLSELYQLPREGRGRAGQDVRCGQSNIII